MSWFNAVIILTLVFIGAVFRLGTIHSNIYTGKLSQTTASSVPRAVVRPVAVSATGTIERLAENDPLQPTQPPQIDIPDLLPNEQRIFIRSASFPVPTWVIIRDSKHNHSDQMLGYRFFSAGYHQSSTTTPVYIQINGGPLLPGAYTAALYDDSAIVHFSRDNSIRVFSPPYKIFEFKIVDCLFSCL
jgi:hypothetical protein